MFSFTVDNDLPIHITQRDWIVVVCADSDFTCPSHSDDWQRVICATVDNVYHVSVTWVLFLDYLILTVVEWVKCYSNRETAFEVVLVFNVPHLNILDDVVKFWVICQH